ncbi:hypothetical protein V8C86DRAFT_346747 [Haematococcus lacustris]
MGSDTVRAPVCLLVLIGLPGAGKSSIAAALARSSGRPDCPVPNASVQVVTFDDYLDAALLNKSETSQTGQLAFSPEAWKASQVQALQQIQLLLQHQPCQPEHVQKQTTVQAPLLVVADDNHPLRSMRYHCCQLARAAFCQLYVRCPLACAMRRNRARTGPRRVPSCALLRLHECMEPPDAAKHSWEASCLTLDSSSMSEGSTQADAGEQDAEDAAARVWQWLRDAWGPAAAAPPSPAQLAAQRTAGQAANDASQLHALDLGTRKLVSTCLATAPPQVSRQELAAALARARHAVLAQGRDCAATLRGGQAIAEQKSKQCTAVSACRQGRPGPAAGLLPANTGHDQGSCPPDINPYVNAGEQQQRVEAEKADQCEVLEAPEAGQQAGSLCAGGNQGGASKDWVPYLMHAFEGICRATLADLMART